MRYKKTIIKENLEYNINSLINKAQKPIIWMVKANAYGHGWKEVSRVLYENSQRIFGVYELKEALELDKTYQGIEIFILDGLSESEWKYLLSHPRINNTFVICLNKIEDLEKAKYLKSNFKFHAFVETGFNWYGINDVKKFFETASKLKIDIEGVCNHFAASDEPESELTKKQLLNFHECLKIAKRYFPQIKTHSSNSNGLLNNLTPHANYYRIGRAMFGGVNDLKQVIKVEVEILQVKDLKAGETVGYGGTFRVLQDTRIAILCAGYSNGIDRRQSNNGYFVIQGKLCPIIGIVAMNTIIVKINNLQVKAGDYATYTDDIDGVRITDIAKRIDVLDYELLTRLSSFESPESSI